MGKTRKEQADASRSLLVKAGRDCFAKMGFEATTVAAVLGRAGMARGALYHYFPGGKQDLFEAVFDSVNDEFHRRRDAVLQAETTAGRVRAGVRLFLECCTEDEFARIALMDAPRLIAGQAGRGSTYALLRSQLEHGVSRGELKGLDPDAAAAALYGAVRSVGEFVSTSGDRDEALDQASRLLDRIVDSIFSQ